MGDLSDDMGDVPGDAVRKATDGRHLPSEVGHRAPDNAQLLPVPPEPPLLMAGKLTGKNGSAECLVRRDPIGAHTIILESVKPQLPPGDYELSVNGLTCPVRFDGRDWLPGTGTRTFTGSSKEDAEQKADEWIRGQPKLRNVTKTNFGISDDSEPTFAPLLKWTVTVHFEGAVI
jgi:hypothetical protein